MSAHPPRPAMWLLSRTIPPDCRDAVLGDLEEEFAEQVLPRLGARRARFWFWLQTLSLARAYVLDTARQLLSPDFINRGPIPCDTIFAMRCAR